MAKKKGDRQKLNATEKELIYQTWLVLNNKTKTAKQCGVAVQTVHRVIKAIEAENATVPATRAARAEVAAEMQSRIHVKANELLESLSKKDIESGRTPVYDAQGNFVRYATYGPSLLQKATSFGIVMDKANVAQQYERALTQDVADGQLMLPGDIAGLKAAINGTIKELKLIDITFENNNQDLMTNVNEVFAEVETIESEPKTEVTSIDDFDTPN